MGGGDSMTGMVRMMENGLHRTSIVRAAEFGFRDWASPESRKKLEELVR